MIFVPRASPKLHISDWFFGVCDCKVQWNTSLLLSHCLPVLDSYYQCTAETYCIPLRFLSVDGEVDKVPHDDQNLWIWSSFLLSEGCLIFFFVIPIADTHCNVATLICFLIVNNKLSAGSYPSLHRALYILVALVHKDTSSLSLFLSVLPKDPVFFHASLIPVSLYIPVWLCIWNKQGMFG